MLIKGRMLIYEYCENLKNLTIEFEKKKSKVSCFIANVWL